MEEEKKKEREKERKIKHARGKNETNARFVSFLFIHVDIFLSYFLLFFMYISSPIFYFFCSCNECSEKEIRKKNVNVYEKKRDKETKNEIKERKPNKVN